MVAGRGEFVYFVMSGRPQGELWRASFPSQYRPRMLRRRGNEEHVRQWTGARKVGSPPDDGERSATTCGREDDDGNLFVATDGTGSMYAIYPARGFH